MTWLPSRNKAFTNLPIGTLLRDEHIQELEEEFRETRLVWDVTGIEEPYCTIHRITLLSNREPVCVHACARVCVRVCGCVGGDCVCARALGLHYFQTVCVCARVRACMFVSKLCGLNCIYIYKDNTVIYHTIWCHRET